MKDKPKIVTINLENYTMSPTQLDNLVSEYYGKILNTSEQVEFIFEIEFEEASHSESFLRALKSFVESE